jgi:hypothetical protein
VSGQIQRGDVNSRLKDYLGLKGFSPVIEVTPEITPVLIVDDLTEPDLRKIGVQTRSATGSAFKAAVAANNSFLKFANPAGSGMLMRVTDVELWTFNGQQIVSLTRVNNGSLLLDGLLQQGMLGNFRLDGNLPFPQACGQFSSESVGGAVPVAPFLWRTYMPNSFPQRLRSLDIILKPNTGILICGETLNAGFGINVKWTESPEELYP